jgi:hypothetical protein
VRPSHGVFSAVEIPRRRPRSRERGHGIGHGMVGIVVGTAVRSAVDGAGLRRVGTHRSALVMLARYLVLLRLPRVRRMQGHFSRRCVGVWVRGLMRWVN